MIRGSFRQEGGRRRPFVTAFVEIPVLQCSGNVPFLVDTGADATLLAPRDATLLGINPQLLPADTPSTGVGGQTQTSYAEAVITLDGQTYGHTIRILAPRGRLQQATLGRIPSLLGRDILAHFALFMEERNNRVLLLDPQEADGLRFPDG